jgi:RHS repeat-associated protein
VSPAGDRLGVRVGSTVNWLLPDLHGSIAGSLAADESLVTNAIRYDAYGQTLATGTGGGTAVGATAWTYQGRLDLSPPALGTPLYDAGARVYAAGLGTFTQLDTVAGSAQDPLSMNRFLYAEANPATMVDPTGHNAIVEDGLIIREAGLYNQRNKHTTHTSYRRGHALQRTGSRTVANVRATASRCARQGGCRANTVSRSVSAPRMSWRDSYNAALADFNSHLSDRDLLAEEARTHEARTGFRSEPWTVHDALDVLGFLPLVGTPFDVANAGLYGYEGDLGMAVLAGASVLPVGDAVKGVRKVMRGADEALDIAARVGDNAAASGWRLGENVNSLTRAGNKPSWSTIRARYWKNTANDATLAGQWDVGNVDRMTQGLAPQRYNPLKGAIESMDLSHEPIPARDGGLDFVPRWPQDHAAIDPFRRPGY